MTEGADEPGRQGEPAGGGGVPPGAGPTFTLHIEGDRRDLRRRMAVAAANLAPPLDRSAYMDLALVLALWGLVNIVRSDVAGAVIPLVGASSSGPLPVGVVGWIAPGSWSVGEERLLILLVRPGETCMGDRFRFVFLVVVPAMVEGALWFAVVGGGGPAFAERDDVVDLATLGGLVAAGMGAGPIGGLENAALGAPEESGALPDAEGLKVRSEHDALHPRVVLQQCDDLPGRGSRSRTRARRCAL
jgi:hypothetical protein